MIFYLIKNQVMKRYYCMILFLFSVCTPIFSQTFDHSPLGGKGQKIEYEQFTISYNEEHEQANWVSYYLEREEIFLPSVDRSSKFKTETRISSGSASHEEYTNTGYDRGHLSRAMYNKKSINAYNESYFITNISPQIGVNFNRSGGDWYMLEELEIIFAKKLGAVYSVTGPIFKDNLEVIGDTVAITVPGYFYKAMLSADHRNAIGFILRHDNIDDDSLWDAAVSIDELEAITGYNFFALLPNKQERAIEAILDLSFWKSLEN